MSRLRPVAALAGALAAVCSVGYLASQTVLAPPPPDPMPRTAYVSAPVPGEVEPTARAGQVVGPPQVDAGWLSTTAASTGIPEPALRAYARVQLDGGGGCGVGWTTLAGIGWVESHHGTLGGRTLLEDGRPSRPVVGPALDGRGRFAAIRATPASTAWHGDPTWEHAVGPMQFLRSSWEPWAVDGDGDGTTDPHDLDDAAATAARYLCASGADLATGDGWAQAVFSYNHEQAYVEAVHAAATTYAARAG